VKHQAKSKGAVQRTATAASSSSSIKPKKVTPRSCAPGDRPVYELVCTRQLTLEAINRN